MRRPPGGFPPTPVRIVDAQAKQSILVKGTVRNPDGNLRSSQFVRARIVWKTAEGLVVPVTAMSRVNGQYCVFVAENADGKLVAHQRLIKVGPIAGDSYPVLYVVVKSLTERRRHDA